MTAGQRVDLTAVKAVPTSAVISASIPLKHAGKQLSACCPLHDDRASSAPPHRIIIRHEVFGTAIEVVVEPSVEGEQLDREFPTLKAAFGYASGLRMVRGWSIVDQTGSPVS